MSCFLRDILQVIHLRQVVIAFGQLIMAIGLLIIALRGGSNRYRSTHNRYT